MDKFTPKAQAAINEAGKCAKKLHQGYIGSEHILAGILTEGTSIAAKVLFDNGIENAKYQDMIKEMLTFDNNVTNLEKGLFSPRAELIMEEARKQAERFGQKEVGTEHILIAII